MTPKISFIIPAFNAAGFIADAIDSVIAQTIPDWELIIVDDNSSDATLHIADRYAAADARIRVIRRTEGSGGGFIPRYEAVAAAKSDFILPLDADDVILPDYAAILLGFISN
ncbi:MAG: glycosyltransferase, partial [Muribaculaceae bacterium]|nr:glycosyltransferase [Muribaculaceae bacterium]